ncbi:MAG: hypothetical protein WC333_06630 [Dehalococcoidia bacterium]|jgi:hypothetical protein
MIEDEIVKKLEEIKQNESIDERHYDADNLLCEVLRSLGCNKIADKFKEMQEHFYYD